MMQEVAFLSSGQLHDLASMMSSCHADVFTVFMHLAEVLLDDGFI